MEVLSNLRPNVFGLNVRRYGPQPCIFVRSFSPFTNLQGIKTRGATLRHPGQLTRALAFDADVYRLYQTVNPFAICSP